MRGTLVTLGCYSHHSSDSFASIDRMFVRVHSRHSKPTPRLSATIDQPAGNESGSPSTAEPQRLHVAIHRAP
jgi:hypothetical protein